MTHVPTKLTDSAFFFAANSASEKLTCFIRDGTVWLHDRRIIGDQVEYVPLMRRINQFFLY